MNVIDLEKKLSSNTPGANKPRMLQQAILDYSWLEGMAHKAFPNLTESEYREIHDRIARIVGW